MKKINDCELVKDLLPNYIDNLTSDETNDFIESHVNQCSECKLLLEEMKKSSVSDEKVKSKKFVNFAKKYNKKLKILKFIVLLILAVILFHLIRNLIIVVPLMNKRKETLLNANNYHYQMYTYTKEHVFLYDFYRKDNKFLETWSSVDILANENITHSPTFWNYYDGNNLYGYHIDEKTGIKFFQHSTMENRSIYPMFMDPNEDFNSLRSILSLVVHPKITRINYHGIECYRIDSSIGHEEQVTCIDKSTGLIIRGINSTNSIFDFYVDLNVVTDEDLKIPNIEEYKPYDEVENILIKSELEDFIKNGEEIPEYYKEYMYLLEK